MCVDAYIAGTSTEFTGCNDMGDKGLNFLDRHDLDCGSGRALQAFTVTQEGGCHYPNCTPMRGSNPRAGVWPGSFRFTHSSTPRVGADQFKYRCAELGAVQETPKLLPGLMIGQNMIQIGRRWRIGAVDPNHLSVGRTPIGGAQTPS